jgi:hypothetical protein
LGANVAIALAHGVSRRFFRAVDESQSGGGPQKMVMTAHADPNEALKLTEPPLKLLRERGDKLLNLTYARVVRRRAEYHEAAGTPGKAKSELSELARDLAARGANPPVIKAYADLESSIGSDKPRRTAVRQPATTKRLRRRRS